MPRQVFDYDPPDRFVAGTVGQPGQRAFFLQATAGVRTTTVALEKAQVAVLAERVEDLLDEVVRRSAGNAPVPALAPADSIDNEPLSTPIEEEFRVGTMSLAWDSDAERVVIECFEIDDSETPEDAEEEVPPTDGSLLRVALTGAAARGFAKRALAVVAAGRPPCPFCGNPLDTEGHVCPRANGYRR
ncbi:MAG: DUF3090 domain-containing protein [Kineosporiaceae bacterium]